MNIAAVEELEGRYPDSDVVLIESGGDNLAATFSPELADLDADLRELLAAWFDVGLLEIL